MTVISGNPDIGGSRASLALMAAEELGVDYAKVRPVIADTASIGFNFVTGGSRVTFATGLAVVNSVRDMIRELKVRAAKIWKVDPDGVIWENGMAKPAGANVGTFEPLTLADLAAQAGRTGGPINGHAQLNVTGAGPGFGVHCVDLEVDDDTGCVTVDRYTAAQDVGTAIHPSYVEGQLQGGAVQGVGWALNEEYIYNAKGTLQNPGFLDYRMPVASDLPMIETILVEVPNPSHPYGVRGVGEVPIVPPTAAVGNAIARAIGVRMVDLPMSPPRLSEALDAARRRDGWRRSSDYRSKPGDGGAAAVSFIKDRDRPRRQAAVRSAAAAWVSGKADFVSPACRSREARLSRASNSSRSKPSCSGQASCLLECGLRRLGLAGQSKNARKRKLRMDDDRAEAARGCLAQGQHGQIFCRCKVAIQPSARARTRGGPQSRRFATCRLRSARVEACWSSRRASAWRPVST